MKLSDIKILCVDDSPLVLKFLKTSLQTDYPQLFFATNGQEGVQAYMQHEPDIVISDFNMPIMKGLEMISKIKAINEEIQVVMLSTESSKSFTFEAASQGVSSYVLKSEASTRIKPTVEKIAKIILQRKNKKDTQANPYDYLQPFLELNEEMTILTDGKEIFSCNNLFLDYLQLPSLKDFFSNFGSLDNLIEDIDSSLTGGKDYLHLVLESPNGSKIKIYNQREKKNQPFIVKAAKIPQKNDLYAVIFFADDEVTSNMTGLDPIEIIDKTCNCLSEDFFAFHLNLLSSVSEQRSEPNCVATFSIAQHKETGVSTLKEEDIAICIHEKLAPTDLLFRYKNGFVALMFSTTKEDAKPRLKSVIVNLKKVISGYQPKIGIVSIQGTPQEKINDYLGKFFI